MSVLWANEDRRSGGHIEYTQADLDKIASDECNCEGARKNRDRNAAIEAGKRAVKRIFKNEKFMQAVGLEAVSPVYDQELDKVTIKAGVRTGTVFLADGKVKCRVQIINSMEDDGSQQLPGEAEAETKQEDEA